MLFLALVAASASAAMACPAGKPLEIVVPYAAGGSLDATTRVVANAVTARTQRPVLVRNVPGASGALGVRDVLSSPADGCTILAGAVNTVVLVPLLNPRAGFAPRQLRPLAKVGSTEIVLISAASFSPRNLDELPAHARATGAPITAGHPGSETMQALGLRLVEKRAGLQFVQVPYNGSARLVSDLLGGHLDLAAVALPVAMPLVRQGSVKVVERLSRRTGYELDSWSGWFVRAEVPANVREVLVEAVLSALDDEDVQRELLRLGAPVPRAADQRRFAADIDRSVVTYGRLVQQQRAKPN